MAAAKKRIDGRRRLSNELDEINPGLERLSHTSNKNAIRHIL